MNENEAFLRILEKDRRFTRETYAFVSDALSFADSLVQTCGENPDVSPDGHMTARFFCRATTLYASFLYGFMASEVLSQLGLRTSSDLGDVVYNLIECDLAKKSEEDSREDFDDVCDLGVELDSMFSFSYGLDETASTQDDEEDADEE